MGDASSVSGGFARKNHVVQFERGEVGIGFRVPKKSRIEERGTI